jgi:hypothetical protein
MVEANDQSDLQLKEERDKERVSAEKCLEEFETTHTAP